MASRFCLGRSGSIRSGWRIEMKGNPCSIAFYESGFL